MNELFGIDTREVKIVDKKESPNEFGVNLFFENGYGASVIKNSYSYGSKDGLYELAVITGNEEDWDLCYSTEIADDVIGYLTEEQVMNFLHEIKNLKE